MMPLPWAPLLLLGVLLASFRRGRFCGSSGHSLTYSCRKMSEPSQGLPHFLSEVNLDDQPITRSDGPTSMMVTLVPWMDEEDAKVFRGLDRRFKNRLSYLNNWIGGLHTWQVIWHCVLKEDGSKGGFLRYGRDGMDFISFNKETLRWEADQALAETVLEKWKKDTSWSQVFLEKTCIEIMQKCLSCKKEALKKAANMGLKVGVTATVLLPTVLFMIFYFDTSQEFEMHPVLRDQDQRQQDQEQRQLRRMEDFQRTQLERGPLGPSWDSC